MFTNNLGDIHSLYRKAAHVVERRTYHIGLS